MVDDIDADCVMFVQSIGNLYLGADTIDAGDQHRFSVSFQLKEPAEETDAAQDLRAMGRAGMTANEFSDFVAKVNIDTGLSVGFLN